MPGYNQAGKFDDILLILIKSVNQHQPKKNQHYQTAKMSYCPGH